MTAACLMSLSAFSVAFAAEGVPFETEGTPVENEDMASLLKETAVRLLTYSEEELQIQKSMVESAENDLQRFLCWMPFLEQRKSMAPLRIWITQLPRQ